MHIAAKVSAWYSRPGKHRLPNGGNQVMYRIPGKYHPFPVPKWRVAY